MVHQLVPDWPVAKLHAFAVDRGATRRDDALFPDWPTNRRAEERISNRRFDYIFADRVQARLECADEEKATGHTLRPHAITLLVEPSPWSSARGAGV